MADPMVREIGRMEDTAGRHVVVSVDYDTVVVLAADAQLTLTQMEELAQLLVAAVWAAGANQARMREVTGG